MPSADEHRQTAANNEAFTADILGLDTPHYGWAVTTIFYTAVHDVQALVVQRGWKVTDKRTNRPRPPKTHSERLGVLDEHAPDLADFYRTLKKRSERARYYGETFTAAEVAEAQDVLAELRSAIAAT